MWEQFVEFNMLQTWQWRGLYGVNKVPLLQLLVQFVSPSQRSVTYGVNTEIQSFECSVLRSTPTYLFVFWRNAIANNSIRSVWACWYSGAAVSLAAGFISLWLHLCSQSTPGWILMFSASTVTIVGWLWLGIRDTEETRSCVSENSSLWTRKRSMCLTAGLCVSPSTGPTLPRQTPQVQNGPTPEEMDLQRRYGPRGLPRPLSVDPVWVGPPGLPPVSGFPCQHELIFTMDYKCLGRFESSLIAGFTLAGEFNLHTLF